MTDLIERAKAALAEATPGPWEVSYKNGTTSLETGEGVTMCDETYYPWTPDKDADWSLIALSPDLAHALIASEARVAELEAENARLREPLELIDSLDPQNDSTTEWNAAFLMVRAALIGASPLNERSEEETDND